MEETRQKENRVLAKVQNREITDEDLDRIIEKYPVEKRIYFQTEGGRKQLLEQKVAFTLFGLYGRDCKRDQTPEFRQHIEDLTDQILTQEIMQELFKDVTVSEEEVQTFYEENPERFKLEKTVNASHILTETEEEANTIYEKIESGKISFEDAAKKYSKCPSSEKEGNLGYFKRGMMVKEFEDVAFSIPLSVCSKPVKTQFGYHLIKVLDQTEPGQIPFDEVKEKLMEELKAVKQQKIYENKLEELKGVYLIR